MLRDEILERAVDGTDCTPEWTALQTIRLYRRWMDQGLHHDEALAAAKWEMQEIAREAMRIRRKKLLRDVVAPWCVIVLGGLACVGWWLLWE